MGGPGSGKSTVVDGLGLKALGLKLVNTDKSFETGLKKAPNFRFKNCACRNQRPNQKESKKTNYKNVR